MLQPELFPRTVEVVNISLRRASCGTWDLHLIARHDGEQWSDAVPDRYTHLIPSVVEDVLFASLRVLNVTESRDTH